MAKMLQILVIGNNDNGCTPELETIAYDAGKEVAKSGSVLITGGLGGVMKAASHGAKDAATQAASAIYLSFAVQTGLCHVLEKSSTRTAQ